MRCPAPHPERRTENGLLGRSDVFWLAGSRSTWAAGSGEECGSSGNKGKFHDFSELVFVRWAPGAGQSAARLAARPIPARQKTRRERGLPVAGKRSIAARCRRSSPGWWGPWRHGGNRVAETGRAVRDSSVRGIDFHILPPSPARVMWSSPVNPWARGPAAPCRPRTAAPGRRGRARRS